LNTAAPDDKYELLSSHNVLGQHTILLSKSKVHSRLSQIQTSSWYQGKTGDRGAANIRF